MYTIRQASLRTGVSVSLIRAWERRYGIVKPARTPSGYRLYDDEALARLRAMRRLIDAGWAAAQAAGEVARPGGTQIDLHGGGVQTAVASGGPAESFVEAARTYDVAALDRQLDGIFAKGSFEAVADDLLLPVVAALGTAWANGRIDVAAEHVASAAVTRRLSALFAQGGTPGSGPGVLVGLPAGSRHEIGASAFAVALRRLGVNVVYLGADVPVASWALAAGESRAVAAVIAVMTAIDAGPALEAARALREARPDIVVAVGGPAAGLAIEASVLLLPGRVADGAQALAEHIRPRA
ncbi:MAG: transcriptional regulator [Anaerolinea sp.]|nr:transcriptional regulator [Anaerolinea sp.]